MNKVRAAQQFFDGVEVILTVENTYRPGLNGTRRQITRVGKSFYDAKLLDASSDGTQPAGRSCRGVIPTRAGEVISVTDSEATFRLGAPGTWIGEHHVTYRKVT